MKMCNKCNRLKPFEQFFKDKQSSDGLYTICKACKKAATLEWRKNNPEKYNEIARNWRKNNPEKEYGHEIKRRYGCSIERYNEMLVEQDFKCKICGKIHDSSKKRGRLYVDHTKDTKIVRGLLCSHCNCAIGYLKHDTELLQKAIEYLKLSSTLKKAA